MVNTPIIVGHKANKRSVLVRYLRLGLQMVEFDVSFLDGRMVVRHGIETGAPGLRRLIMNYGYLLIEGKDPIWRPSSLEDHLEEVAGRAGAWLDVKTRGIEKDVVKSALSRGVRKVVVSTGFHNMLRPLKESYPEVLAMLGNVDYRPANPVKEVELASADGLSINFHFVDKELVDELHSVGYSVAVWTVNDLGMARRLAELGVDYLITDIPEKITKFFRA